MNCFAKLSATQVYDVANKTNRIHACFAMKRSEFAKLAGKSSKFYCLRVKIRRQRDMGNRICWFFNCGELIGSVEVQLDLKSIVENLGNNCSRAFVIQNGWILVAGADAKLHLNVRAEPELRFVFRFNGEPKCSPQVFQINGNVKQPIFTYKFGFRISGDRDLRSRGDGPEVEVEAAHAACAEDAATFVALAAAT